MRVVFKISFISLFVFISTLFAEDKLPKLVDLGAKKCIPCKTMAPILEELTIEYKGVFDVEFIDVWISTNKTKANFYKIKSIPTQIFLDQNGKELFRHEGVMYKDDILNKWKELGYDFNVKKDNSTKKVSTKNTPCCSNSAKK